MALSLSLRLAPRCPLVLPLLAVASQRRTLATATAPASASPASPEPTAPISTPSGVTLPSLNNASFPHRWLRDACRCPACVHPSTSQKLFRTSDIPPDVRPQSTLASDGVAATADGSLHITWSDGHQSTYAHDFLARYASPHARAAFHRDVAQAAWDGAGIARVDGLFLPYDSLQSPRGLLAGITQLTRHGLLFVTGVPHEQTGDAACELRKLASLFGEIRETFYGATWDVKNVKDSTNIAYTNLDLGLHMDLLYFQHPPRYQILHSLRNRVAGGTSIFVDGLHAASVLRSSDPAAFDLLTRTRVPFHYINDGHHLHYEHPTIQLGPHSPLSASPSASTPAPDSSSTPAPDSTSASPSDAAPITHINYSPPFQAPLLLDTPPAFYDALARFARLLDDPASRYAYTLREGDAVLFDNRRVLHARTAFEDLPGDKGGTAKEGGSKEGESEGKEGEAVAAAAAAGEGENTNRWLKGCYLEADAILDRGRVLRAKLGQ